MANYERYTPEFQASDGRIYGVKDKDAREEIANLNSALYVSTGNKQIEMTAGGYYPLNGTSITIGAPTPYQTEKYALVSCSEGDVFTVSGTGDGTARPWAFVSSNGDILLKSTNTTEVTLTNVVITAPENTAYLVLNNQSTSTAISYYGVYLVEIEKETSNKLSSLINDIFATGDKCYSLDDIPNVTYKALSNATTNSSTVTISDNSDYDSYYFVTDGAYDIYCIPTGSNYYALCKLENFSGWSTHSTYIDATGTNGARYRTSESNLPSAGNPLSVPFGTLIAVTVPKNTNAQIVFKNQLLKKMNNDYELNTNQIKVARNPMYIKYVGSSGYDSSTEHVEIYIPQTEGYLQYDLLHCVYATNNCDIWRMGKAYKCDSAFSTVAELTTTGEWECAIKLTGRSDFAGGYIHGDEILTSAVFFIDGKAVDITDYTSATMVERLDLVQYSTLYDPSDTSTAFAKHGSVHSFNRFNENNLVIKQSVKWLGTYTIGNSYLAMLPVLKTITDHFYTDKSYEPKAITLDYTEGKVKDAVLYKESANVSVNFAIPQYPSVDSLSGTFLMTDNGGLAYNKCYYIIGGSETSIANNTLWQTETNYNFSC